MRYAGMAAVYSPSSIPTVDEMQELSALGWGTSWDVVGSSLRTMVEGCGADQDWVQLSEKSWEHRQARAAAAEYRRLRDARLRATRARREATRAIERRAVNERAERLREARYEEEARQARVTLREYRRTHPYGVEAFGPAGPYGEKIWYPIEMRLATEREALSLAAHLHWAQGLTTRAVRW